MPHYILLTVRGQHYLSCDGWVRQLPPAQDSEWRGCLPRPAEGGLLCWSCVEKARAAVAGAVDTITHLRSIERVPTDASGVRTAPGSRVILPRSWQAADRLWESLAATAVAYSVDWTINEPPVLNQHDLRHLGSFATVEQVRDDVREVVTYLGHGFARLIAKDHGAEATLRLMRDSHDVTNQFPAEGRPRTIRYITCRSCGTQSLRQMPPLAYTEPIVIDCTNRACGALYNPQMVTWDLNRLIEDLQAQLADQQTDGQRHDQEKPESPVGAGRTTVPSGPAQCAQSRKPLPLVYVGFRVRPERPQFRVQLVAVNVTVPPLPQEDVQIAQIPGGFVREEVIEVE